MDFTPQRIVSLQPSATQIICELGLGQRIVACTKWCTAVAPQVADGRMIVADSWTAKSAEILGAKPDFVIASVPYQEDAVAQILRAGIPFLALAPRTLADVYGDIAKIAALLGVTEGGNELIARMQREITDVQHRTTLAAGSGQRLRVFCEEWGKPIIASQPWVRELVEAAGGDFISEAGKKTTADAVRAAQPDVIIAAWCGAGDRVPLEKIVHQRGWQETPAARAGRVYCVNDELLNTPGPALLGGLRALASAIRPEDSASNTAGLRRIRAAKDS